MDIKEQHKFNLVSCYRLGGSEDDASDIQRHSFFDPIDWQLLVQKKVGCHGNRIYLVYPTYFHGMVFSNDILNRCLGSLFKIILRLLELKLIRFKISNYQLKCVPLFHPKVSL